MMQSDALAKVNLFLVGAAKSGTSALAEYLRNSEAVYVPSVKEPNFFCADIDPELFANNYKRDQLIEPNAIHVQRHSAWIRDLSVYESLYSGSLARYRLDASVSYLYSTVAASEIFNYNPDSRILILLRNPVRRAYSHYCMNLQRGYAKSSFTNEVLRDVERLDKGWGVSQLYVELGLYYEQLARYLEAFPLENVMVVDSEELRSNTHAALESVCTFLGIEMPIIKSPKPVNPSRTPKWPWLQRALKTAYKSLDWRWLSKTAPIVKETMYSRGPLPALSQSDYKRVSGLFDADWQRTLNLLGEHRQDLTLIGFKIR
jgi:hypothetical protein